jgi:hypothetical protein
MSLFTREVVTNIFDANYLEIELKENKTPNKKKIERLSI